MFRLGTWGPFGVIERKKKKKKRNPGKTEGNFDI